MYILLCNSGDVSSSKERCALGGGASERQRCWDLLVSGVCWFRAGLTGHLPSPVCPRPQEPAWGEKRHQLPEELHPAPQLILLVQCSFSCAGFLGFWSCPCCHCYDVWLPGGHCFVLCNDIFLFEFSEQLTCLREGFSSRELKMSSLVVPS